MKFDEDAPLAKSFKRKRNPIPKEKQPEPEPEEPSEPAHDPEPATANPPPDITLDYSVENHFKAVDAIARLCGHFGTEDADPAEIKRFSNSITFLREWRDFSYKPRTVRFARQRNLKEKDVVGEVALHQFSATPVPKEEMGNGDEAVSDSSKDFVMYVGGSVWALDWCPRADRDSENHIKSEFVAIAAHPPESSYHKIGAPLTGRGAIQIWCLLTITEKDDVPNPGNKKPRRNSQEMVTFKFNDPTKPPRPRGRPRKKPLNDSVPPGPRGRPRKKHLNDSVDNIDNDDQYVQPLAIEYPTCSARLRSSVGLSTNSLEPVYDDGSVNTHKGSNQTENANLLLLTAPKGRGNTARTRKKDQVHKEKANSPQHVNYEDSVNTHKGSNQTDNSNLLLLTAPKDRGNKTEARKKDQVHNNGSHIPRQCERGESDLIDPLASAGFSLDSRSPDKNITSINACDANTSQNSIPSDVALPRLMLCLAHNGKVAWDVKWRPVSAHQPQSMHVMGYLAVLLGNGALEVWEVPLPHTVKLVYPSCQELIDPRFIKLKPVFRCSKLKCGDRQSIPLTMEWSASSPNDMILAGCHDGVVALWKFSVTDSLTETRPLLSFSAETGPIRTLSWAPVQSDLETANVFVTAGHKGVKFWDVRDPFRPLRDYPIMGATYGLDWLPDLRCVLGVIDDGTLWLLNLEKAANDIPVTGKCLPVKTKQGLNSFDCSSFSIWGVQASRLTGLVAYCGEDGTTLCFQPTTRSIKDRRNRVHHYLCGSLLEEGPALVVATPLPNSTFSARFPGMKRPGPPIVKEHENRTKEQMVCGNGPVEGEGESKSKQSKDVEKREIENFPPKIVAMHRVRWNVNKGSERWLCYGGTAGLVRCQEVDLSVFQ